MSGVFPQSGDVQEYVSNAAIWGIGVYLIAKVTGLGGEMSPATVAMMAAIGSTIKTRYDLDAKRIGRKNSLRGKGSPTKYISGTHA